MKTFSKLFALMILLFLCACSNVTKRIAYEGSQLHGVNSAATPECKKIFVKSVKDSRSTDDNTKYGTVRGGFGNPLKHLYSDIPIADNIKEMLEDALKYRGCLGDKENYDFLLYADLKRLHSDVLSKREVDISMGVQVKNKKNNDVLSWTENTKSLEFNGMAQGLLVDMDDYQKNVQSVFVTMTNNILDNEKLRSFLNTSNKVDISKRLDILKQLYEKKEISLDEYESRRSAILNEI